jgi:hypothetical protein
MVTSNWESFYTAVKLGSEGSPSAAVDQAWHAYILNVLMYFEFTWYVNGHLREGGNWRILEKNC